MRNLILSARNRSYRIWDRNDRIVFRRLFSVEAMPVGFVVEDRGDLITLGGLSHRNVQLGNIVRTNDNREVLICQLRKDECLAIDVSDRDKSGVPTSLANKFVIPVTDEFFGNVVDPFGKFKPLENSFEPKKSFAKIYERVLPFSSSSKENKSENGIFSRDLVYKQIITGNNQIDLFSPIGFGMSFAILGNPRVSKTEFAIDLLNGIRKNHSNHRKNSFQFGGNDVLCIYVGIGKTSTEISKIHDRLKGAASEGLDRSLIVLAADFDGKIRQNQQIIAPFSAGAIAEHYSKLRRRDVVLLIDSFSTFTSILTEKVSRNQDKIRMIRESLENILSECGQFSPKYFSGSKTTIVLCDKLENPEEVTSVFDIIPSETVVSLANDRIRLFESGKEKSLDVSKVIHRPSPKFHHAFYRFLLREVSNSLIYLNYKPVEKDAVKLYSGLGLEEDQLIERIYPQSVIGIASMSKDEISAGKNHDLLRIWAALNVASLLHAKRGSELLLFSPQDLANGILSYIKENSPTLLSMVELMSLDDEPSDEMKRAVADVALDYVDSGAVSLIRPSRSSLLFRKQTGV